MFYNRNQANFNQENSNQQHLKTPAAKQQSSSHHHSGTTTVNGKQSLQATAARNTILANKDKNTVKRKDTVTLQFTKPTPKLPIASTSALLQNDKPIQQALLSPPPAQTLPSHLRTPSPTLHRLAPLTLLSPASSDGEELCEAEQPLQQLQPPELDQDMDVEYAGPSATDYEEPYEDYSTALMPDWRTIKIGPALHSLPLGTSLAGYDHDQWAQQDDELRSLQKIEIEVEDDSELTERSRRRAREEEQDRQTERDSPWFPLPKSLLALPTPSSNARPAAGAKSSSTSSVTTTRTTTANKSSSSSSSSKTTATHHPRKPLESSSIRKPTTTTPRPFVLSASTSRSSSTAVGGQSSRSGSTITTGSSMARGGPLTSATVLRGPLATTNSAGRRPPLVVSSASAKSSLSTISKLASSSSTTTSSNRNRESVRGTSTSTTRRPIARQASSSLAFLSEEQTFQVLRGTDEEEKELGVWGLGDGEEECLFEDDVGLVKEEFTFDLAEEGGGAGFAI
ncbi:hypothetical protein T439DRAFT_330320 [Meredithblackwellia eburnea MCA 4105]